MKTSPEEMVVLIDFEKRFAEYLHGCMSKKTLSEDQLEERVPDMYLEWLGMPADWLEGQSPNAYFSSMQDAKLIETLGKYVLAGVSLPGPLLGCIVERSGQTYPLLVSLMQNYEGEKSDALKTTILRLIEEMDMPRPYAYYISVIAAADEASDFTEACAEELKDAGASQLEEVIAAYEAAKSRYAADCFLDILADMPYDTRAFEYTLERFLYSEHQKAFYASLLGKLGNEKALPYLEEALRLPAIRYYDYAAVKNAYEALGGEIEIERDFSGDADYDTLTKRGK